MELPYSAFADWLSKFHAAPESIQALWLLTLTVTVLGTIAIVMRGLVAIARPRYGTGTRHIRSIGHEPGIDPATVFPVMAGLDSGLHDVIGTRVHDVGPRIKSGDDGEGHSPSRLTPPAGPHSARRGGR